MSNNHRVPGGDNDRYCRFDLSRGLVDDTSVSWFVVVVSFFRPRWSVSVRTERNETLATGRRRSIVFGRREKLFPSNERQVAVDRFRVVVERGSLAKDQNCAHNGSDGEYPQEQPIQHHGHETPVLIFLRRTKQIEYCATNVIDENDFFCF